jgi:DNA-binding transcriptional MocR family regulator
MKFSATASVKSRAKTNSGVMRQNTPVYEQLAGLLGDMIQSRSLRAGDRMPSVRQFSLQQRVSVPTALRAYVALETRGLVEARPKSGFYVRSRPADFIPEPAKSVAPPKAATPAADDPVTSLLADLSSSKLVPLGAALPSAELLPGNKLIRAMAAIGRKLGPRSVDYDIAPGAEVLRRELSRRSLTWGCALKADEFVITVGATEALSLALRATCQPGDKVVVESPTYFGLAAMLRELKLKAVPVPVDSAQGIDLEILEKTIKKTKIAACVVIPNVHNPIGFIMPEERKRKLVSICTGQGVAVIEDDTYGDLQYSGTRARCLKAFDSGDSVILCGSYSKKLAPGYRVGYIAAGKWQQRVLALKQASTLNGALLPSLAVAEFLKNGGYDRYLRSVRQTYQNQVERMREAIADNFPQGVCLSRPKGGYLLWCELPVGIDALKLFTQAREAGISIAPGPMFSPTGDFRNFIRINCGHPWSASIERAVETLGRFAKKQM